MTTDTPARQPQDRGTVQPFPFEHEDLRTPARSAPYAGGRTRRNPGGHLDHYIQVANVDTQFQRAGADDTGTILRVERLFRQFSGCRRDRRMVDVKVPDPPGTRIQNMLLACISQCTKGEKQCPFM